MSIQDTRRANLRVWTQKHGTPSKEKSYFSQILSGTSPIGERAARRLERDYRMGEGFLDAENPTVSPSPPEPRIKPEATTWPFPEIPEDQVRALPPSKLSALQGALALAIAQLNIGLNVSKPQRPPSIVEQARALNDQQPASNDDEYAYIDRLDVKLAAGYGKIVHHVEHKARLSFLRSWLRTQGIHDAKRAVLVDVEGDSMDPTLPDGATVLVDLSRKEILSGHVYAFAQNGALSVKRLRQEESGVFAHSDNLAYKPFQLTESATIIGRVFWVGAAVGERCV